MAVTVFLFILLLGGIAGGAEESNNINDLVKIIQSNCYVALKDDKDGEFICDNFVNIFREDTNNGRHCNDANFDDVARTYLLTLSIPVMSPQSRPDKTLLWSGGDTGEKAFHQDSKDSLDKTPAAKSLWSLHWAKKAQSTNISWRSSSEKCDSYYHSGDCTYPLEDLYWALASSRFAAQAQGEVEVYLAPTAEGRAYHEESFFWKYEVKKLTKGKVTNVKVQLFNSTTCDIPGMTELINELANKEITCECGMPRTSKPADTGDRSLTEPYWRPDGTCDSCMKLPSVITIIIPIFTLVVKS